LNKDFDKIANNKNTNKNKITNSNKKNTKTTKIKLKNY
jgi:hypothetical protein